MKQKQTAFLLMVLCGVGLGAGAYMIWRDAPTTDIGASPGTSGATTTTPATSSTTERPTTTTSTSSTTTTTTLPKRPLNQIPGWTVGQPWGEVPGITMFRGSPTRTYYGSGPIGPDPSLVWRYPSDGGMCAMTSIGGEQTRWCGQGWTGQPTIHERPDGKTWLIFGAYDRSVHFVDAATGEELLPKFVTGDIIKGTVTVDPDGYPLVYFGSRDNKLRVIAFDGDKPRELWSLDANAVRGTWNNDWDSNPIVIDDILYAGGENGWFFAYAINRGYDSDGRVTIDMERLLAIPSFDQEWISRSGRNLSIESSPVAYEQRVYFANSGGRVMGLDVSDIRNGNAPVVFDFWAGGDIDATPFVDEEGFLYISVEYEPGDLGGTARTRRNLERNAEVGQLVKLDPYKPDDPIVWALDLRKGSGNSGVWGTPALYRGYLYVPTHTGELHVVNATTGEITWTERVSAHLWASPVIVDDVLVQAICTGEHAGSVRGYSVADPEKLEVLWTFPAANSCIESSPIVWKGTIYVGSRDGYLRAIR